MKLMAMGVLESWPKMGCLVCQDNEQILYSILVGCRCGFYDENGYLMARVEVVMVTGCFESQHNLNIVSCFDENDIINVWNY